MQEKTVKGNTSEIESIMKQVNVSSGTGAKLFAWSSTIGGIGSINIEEQGYNYSEDPLISKTSHHPMLITNTYDKSYKRYCNNWCNI